MKNLTPYFWSADKENFLLVFLVSFLCHNTSHCFTSVCKYVKTASGCLSKEFNRRLRIVLLFITMRFSQGICYWGWCELSPAKFLRVSLISWLLLCIPVCGSDVFKEFCNKSFTTIHALGILQIRGLMGKKLHHIPSSSHGRSRRFFGKFSW